MTKLKARAYINGDEIELVQVYNLVTNNNKTIEQHTWQWLQTPHGAGEIFIIEDSSKSKDKIIGHHGLIPITLKYFQENKLLGKTENTFLHPNYLGTGTYYFHEMRFYKQYKDKFDFLLTTSGHGAPGKMRLKLGYKKLGLHVQYYKLCNPFLLRNLAQYYCKSKGLPTLLSPLLWVILFLQYFMNFSGGKRLLPKARLIIRDASNLNKNEINEFWNRIKDQYDITIDRNYEYLNWRISTNPGIKYKVVYLYQEGTLQGYLIYQVSKSQMPCVIIEDLIVSQNSQLLFDKLVYALEAEAKKIEISYIFFSQIQSNNILVKLIENHGFKLNRRKNKESYVLVKSHLNGSSDYDSDKWYYTDLFKEGF
jgi:hypothetical protein